MSYEVWGEPDDGPELPDGWLDEDQVEEMIERIALLQALLQRAMPTMQHSIKCEDSAVTLHCLLCDIRTALTPNAK